MFPNEDAGPALDEMGNPIQAIGPDGMPMMEPDPNAPPPPIDPETGTPLMDPPMRPVFLPATEVPGWMPRTGIDNIGVHRTVFSDWLKTTDYERLPDEHVPALGDAIVRYFSEGARVEVSASR